MSGSTETRLFLLAAAGSTSSAIAPAGSVTRRRRVIAVDNPLSDVGRPTTCQAGIGLAEPLDHRAMLAQELVLLLGRQQAEVGAHPAVR